MGDDLNIPKGTDWAIEWPVEDDLTGYDVWAQVRASRSSSTVLHEWSTTIGNAEAGDGLVRLSVDHEESAAWEWSGGYYDVLLTSPEGSRELLDRGQGRVRVSTTVTREDEETP